MKKVNGFFQEYGALIVTGLLVVVLIIVVLNFRKTKAQASEGDYKEKMEYLDRERAALAKERAALSTVLNQHDSAIVLLNRLDSITNVNIQSNNKTIYEIQQQRKALSRFDKYTSDELKQFFSNLR